MTNDVKEDIFLCFYEAGELKGIARKNGSIEWFKVERMDYTGLLDLFAADKLV